MDIGSYSSYCLQQPEELNQPWDPGSQSSQSQLRHQFQAESRIHKHNIHLAFSKRRGLIFLSLGCLGIFFSKSKSLRPSTEEKHVSSEICPWNSPRKKHRWETAPKTLYISQMMNLIIKSEKSIVTDDEKCCIQSSQDLYVDHGQC